MTSTNWDLQLEAHPRKKGYHALQSTTVIIYFDKLFFKTYMRMVLSGPLAKEESGPLGFERFSDW